MSAEMTDQVLQGLGKMAGKVALITGAAQGQGESHALTLAREGADLILCDVAEDGLRETAAAARELGRSVVAESADIRDAAAMDALVAAGVAELGGIDAVVANAAVFDTEGFVWELTPDEWRNMIENNLNGTWNTVRAAVPSMIEGGKGGAVVMTGSGSSVIGFPRIAHYNAAKHGVIGLMRTLANELAPHRIRVNAVSPSAVNTPMIMNQKFFTAFAGGKPDATIEDAMPAMRAQNVLPNPWVETQDISNAVLFLVADGRYITGVDLPVDSGTRIQPPGMPPSSWE